MNSTYQTLNSNADEWKNESVIGSGGKFSWKEVLSVASNVIKELEIITEEDLEFQKDEITSKFKFRIRYHTALALMHTQPLDYEYCQAYNLFMAVLVTGDFLLFGDWCLFYGLNEQEFLNRWQTDRELQLVWTFFDTLYNKLAGLKLIDNNMLKRYESSRASGHFLPYTERAVISDVVSRNKILLERGEELAKQLMSEEIEG